jgi:hypothetical protein
VSSDIRASAAYVVGDGSRDLMTVGITKNDTLSQALRIDATGKLVLPNDNTIQVEETKLVINAPNGMEVRGDLNINGSASVNSKEIAVRKF